MLFVWAAIRNDHFCDNNKRMRYLRVMHIFGVIKGMVASRKIWHKWLACVNHLLEQKGSKTQEIYLLFVKITNFCF